MTTIETTRPWDFSHVLELVNSLSFQDSTSNATAGQNDSKNIPNGGTRDEGVEEVARKDFVPQSSSLGDFSKLWQLFGTPEAPPLASLSVSSASAPEAAPPIFTTNTNYASDGGTQSKSYAEPKRSVRWQDVSDTDDPATDAVSDGSVVPESPTLTKSQRKKQNRRARKAKEAYLAELKESKNAAKKQLASVSESEADFISRKAPAKKASIHVGAGTARTARSALPVQVVPTTSAPPQTPKSLQEAAREAATKVQSAKDSALTRPAHVNINAPSTPKTKNIQTSESLPRLPNGYNHTKSVARLPGSASAKVKPGQAALQFLPATVGAAAPVQPVPSSPAPQTIHDQHTMPSSHAQQIRPLVVRSGEDRHWALLLKLLAHYKEDSKYILNPMNLTTHNNDPNGIHVFVDASNIFIGFNDQLKRSRGIPPWTQMPPVDLSFDALALLMERRRPVAKRVLAGSNPWLPAFDKAKAVGYECSILEKVYKARELTERQIFFKEHDRFGVRKHAKAPPANNIATVNGAGSGSGSETNTPQYAPARMIEQGVDEILHLKILESIVDSDTPSTIVLATGDAAQAEYSQGFMAMAERALKKGWTIELVSWSKNISAMYRRREWMEAWGSRFRIVFLDDYAEELLDM